jgi:hypothetical protein
MSGQVQVTQVESQDTRVEQEYHGEEKREYKSMYVDLLPPKFNVNLLTKTYDDNLSTGSADYSMNSTFLTTSSDRFCLADLIC